MPATYEKTRSPTFYIAKKNPVKLTALLYLKEALHNQRYEQCSEFIAIAREFGANAQEIQELLEDSRRVPR